MNVEAYDLDSLRKIIRDLQKENKVLKEQLKTAGIAFSEQNHFSGRVMEIHIRSTPAIAKPKATAEQLRTSR